MAIDPPLMAGGPQSPGVLPGTAPSQDPLIRLLAALNPSQEAQGAAPTAFDDHLTGSAIIDALNRRPQADFGPNGPPPGFVAPQAIPHPPSPYPLQPGPLAPSYYNQPGVYQHAQPRNR